MDQAMQPVDLAAGRQSFNLLPPSGQTQTPDGVPTKLVNVYNGPLAMTVYDEGDVVVPRTDYRYTGTSFVFGDDVLPPSGAYVSAYTEPNAATHTTWALLGSSLYAGDNDSFQGIRVRVDAGPEQLVEPATGDNSYITTAAASGVKASYAVTHAYTQWFIGESNNWITDHIRMRPDVFVGTEDYPGDQVVINGVPVEPGLMPSYRDPDTYIVRARDGMVIFGEWINSTDHPVRAHYAHLIGIRNVTAQKLDAVGPSGVTFKADSETAFPDSHGAQWVRHQSVDRPTNIYVDNTPVPQITTITPFDELSIKTAP